MTSKTAPYATWSSPISAKAITAGIVALSDVVVDPKQSVVYRLESRPSEAGRNVLVNTETGRDVVGQGWNFRTAVHEYGGASAIAYDGVVYFSNFGDGRVYRVKDDGEPEPITPENKAHRFANFDPHPKLPLLVSILEDHTTDNAADVVTTLCIINIDTKTISTFISGADFYATPKFSPDGTRIAWLEWFHPDMSWDGGMIRVADVVVNGQDHSLSIKNDVLVGGVAGKVSCYYPSWANNDTLVFTSDESGFWNPWKYTNGKASPIFPEPISQEFGGPLKQLNFSPYAFVDTEGQYAIFTAMKDGRSIIYLVGIEGKFNPVLLDSPYVVVQNIRSISREKNEVVFTAEQADASSTIVKCTVSLADRSANFTTSSPNVSKFPPELISRPQPISLTMGDSLVHVVFYGPVNPEYAGSSIEGEKPPCILSVHGGPTGISTQGLDWMKQYHTSRGWAWLDVNYGGSFGYGRAYIERLAGQWGVVDVEDCIGAARALSNAPYNLIDLKRVVIRGASAGGYTTLAALSIGSDLRAFAAGTSLFGVSDLRKLTESTHKYESKYLDKLIGGTFEQVPEIFNARSPIFHADKIVSPLLILQGDIDKVVPKDQAEDMYNTIKARGGVVEYKLYAGEGHGWRQEANIRDSLEREIRFYEDVLKLKS